MNIFKNFHLTNLYSRLNSYWKKYSFAILLIVVVKIMISKNSNSALGTLLTILFAIVLHSSYSRAKTKLRKYLLAALSLLLFITATIVSRTNFYEFREYIFFIPLLYSLVLTDIYSPNVVGFIIISLFATIFKKDLPTTELFLENAKQILIASLCVSIIFYLLRKLLRERNAYHMASITDQLTRLPNRNLFHEDLAAALKKHGGTNQSLALLYLDLDGFKTVNDTLNHTTGDLLLQAVAKRFLEVCNKNFKVYRIGGDEFVFILQNLTNDVDHPKQLSSKILRMFDEPFKIQNHELYITTSIGVARYPTDGKDLETLVRNADTAMYQAKEKGKNKFQFYSPNMNNEALEKFNLEIDLRKALELDQFTIYYQPKICIHSAQIIGAEALIRWLHPKYGIVSPGLFIPIAEENGLIIKIGEWVIRKACAQNKVWQDMGIPPLKMGVNLSARQFQQIDLVEMVEQILLETGMAPQWLELEITESTLMKSPEDNIYKLKKLKAMGVSLSIDDFGIAYSSLNYLKRFPLDTLKIDMSFIRDVITDPNDAAITKAIIQLGHNLNLKVIAEGVETKEQLAFLAKEESDEAQGYYFSPPMKPEEFVTTLRDFKKGNTESL